MYLIYLIRVWAVFFLNHNNNKILKSDWLSTVLILGSYLSNWTAPSLALEWFFLVVVFFVVVVVICLLLFLFFTASKISGNFLRLLLQKSKKYLWILLYRWLSIAPFQNEAKWTTFLVELSFTCIRMKNHFHIKGWALNLVLILRPGGTRKWRIGNGLLVVQFGL